MDALVGSVLFVEFKNFVVFANGSGPVVDVVFIKDNNGVALAARDSSADAYTHTNKSNEELFAYGSMGDVDFVEAVGEDVVVENLDEALAGKGGAVESGVVVGTE